MSAPQGSCLCGGLTFTLKGESSNRFTCYCVDCRKNSGHLGQVLAIYDTSNIEISDPHNYRKEYIVTGTSSGHPKHKVFCSNCGCTIMTVPMKHNGDKSVIRATLLDSGFETLVPQKALFAQTKDEYLGDIKSEFL